MSVPELAIDVVLEHEGSRYTNRPNDRGGPTRWGITLATLERVRPGATAPDVQALTRDEAVAIYRQLYWPDGYSLISDQRVATKLFDIGVNSGPRFAVRLAQQAAANLGRELVIDGRFGPATCAALNACDPTALLREMGGLQRAHYLAIVVADPTQEENLRGWLARAAWPWPARAAAGVA